MNGSARCIAYDSGATLSDMRDQRKTDLTGWWKLDLRDWAFCFAYVTLLYVAFVIGGGL